MNRHYYITDDIDDLEVIEYELKVAGLARTQIHVLSEMDQQVSERQLPEVEAVLRQDVVRGTEMGALVGLLIASAVLLFAYLSGIPESVTWVPFIFLAVVVLGFCTWEGGLFGIQVPNSQFSRFADSLSAGRDVLFVDVEGQQEAVLERVVDQHPQLQLAGSGLATPHWFLEAQNKWQHFIKVMP
jgi:hypothetical protein